MIESIKGSYARKEFLQNLPEVSIKSVFIKTIIIGIVGFILSLLTIGVTFFVFQEEATIKGTNRQYFLALISQNVPFLLLTFVLFYRGKIKETISQFFPKVANKSVKLILGVLILNLVLGAIFNLIGFTFYRTPERWNWLESYVNSGPDKITFDYLQTLFGSFIIFLFIALSEEFVFRFTIFRFLRKKGLILALLISSLLFMSIHGGFNIQFLLFGIIIALYYEFTNYFLGTVLIHAFNNLLVVFYSYYLVYYLLS